MEATEQKIVNAAIEVFNTDLSANLELVAEQAGVTRRTLHRYFKDRTQLMDACQTEMQYKCRTAMMAAINTSTDPLVQLENMLYAGIDCGSKYAFLDKLQQHPPYRQMPDGDEGEFDAVKKHWFAIVGKLQKAGIISTELTPAWIFVLFGGMVTTTINALNSGNVARNDIKHFAWFSFSRSVGIQVIAGAQSS
ncbi:TetR/AcrR family transcriptional regulator [Mucilaginibacter sp. CSA2-8R]|uniref:TetR/AcrR family transcriptional regulator n=1 Tax=Mucilaginibacter sp. CSA2-8R TaxID=3141542 RepID=UPI00315D23EF